MLHWRSFDWRVALATAALGASALLVACGGGGGAGAGASMVAADATSYAQGAITGFGSIIVGGVHYDETGAAVADEDGASHQASDLKLGMMVQVDAGRVDRVAGKATARRFLFGAEVLGPVGTVDVAGSTVQVLGQTVLVTSSTVFSDALSGGLASLTPGAVVEVHGIPDPANSRIVATRIEDKAAATTYALRGTVAALDSTAKTFTLGGQLISYAGLAAADVPAGLANGQVVRALLQTTPQAGAWVATKLRGADRRPAPQGDARLEGAITALTSTTSFTVNGLQVDATNATFPDGTAGVVLGARVEVSGSIANGVMTATRVEVRERRDPMQRPLEIHGAVGNLDTNAKTFALRGVTIWYGGNVSYPTGSEADLANGKNVTVRGVLSTDRTRLEARTIDYRN